MYLERFDAQSLLRKKLWAMWGHPHSTHYFVVWGQAIFFPGMECKYDQKIVTYIPINLNCFHDNMSIFELFWFFFKIIAKEICLQMVQMMVVKNYCQTRYYCDYIQTCWLLKYTVYIGYHYDCIYLWFNAYSGFLITVQIKR